nr:MULTISPECIES: patatin-like phospholipase family protein [Ramlibacter]
MACLLLAACATPERPVVPVPIPVAPPAVSVPVPPRLGLALGGGAARGFAHVGVIQVLEEAGLRPDLVVGTSAGSLVAVLYASGRTGAQLQQVAEGMDEAAFTDWTLPLFNRGVLKGEALARYVNAQVGNRLLEQMAMPVGVVSTRLDTGEGVLFQRGDTGTAVRASSAVPAVFLPVRINGAEYVDGGLVAPVPVRYARRMGADVVLAIDISAATEGNPSADPLQMLMQTFAIMGKSINRWELQEADVVVRPPLASMSGADFASRRRAIDAGRTAMLRLLPQLKAAMAAKTK